MVGGQIKSAARPCAPTMTEAAAAATITSEICCRRLRRQPPTPRHIQKTSAINLCATRLVTMLLMCCLIASFVLSLTTGSASITDPPWLGDVAVSSNGAHSGTQIAAAQSLSSSQAAAMEASAKQAVQQHYQHQPQEHSLQQQQSQQQQSPVATSSGVAHHNHAHQSSTSQNQHQHSNQNQHQNQHQTQISVVARPGGQLQQSQSAVGARRHKAMSCYVCSTMDYDNQMDNPCRTMPREQIDVQPALVQMRSSTGLRPSLPGAGQHLASSRHSSSSTTSTSTSTSITGGVQEENGNVHALSWSSTDDVTSEDVDYSSGGSPYDAASMMDDDGGGPPGARGLSKRDLRTGYETASGNTSLATPADANKSMLSNLHSVVPRSNYVPYRTCHDDEFFCSVVTVVRLDYEKRSVVQSFWAMERNCSRSCNTGCMLIGERVRLRVCSQCCRSFNCNSYNGANSRAYPVNWITMCALTALGALASAASLLCLGAHHSKPLLARIWSC